MSIKKGFTLVELLIVMGIFSILLIVLTDIFVNSLNIKLLSESSSYLQQDGRFISQKLMFDINNASSISSPTLGQTSSSLQILLYGTPRIYSFNSSTHNLELTENGITYILNSFNTNVTNFTFTRIGTVGGKNSIQIIYTLQSKIIEHNTQEQLQFETAVSPR